MVLTLIGRDPLLCLVTDRSLVAPGRLLDVVRLAVKGGVVMVQLREKDLSSDQAAALALDIRRVCDGRAIVMVNGDAVAAARASADGVHLPETDDSVGESRKRLGQGKLVGRSVHSVESALAAEAEGVDYLICGTMFLTRSKPGKEPEGLALLRKVTAAVRMPVLGIGGITAGNAASVLDAGAAGVAVMSALLSSPDPEGAARKIIEAMSNRPLRSSIEFVKALTDTTGHEEWVAGTGSPRGSKPPARRPNKAMKSEADWEPLSGQVGGRR